MFSSRRDKIVARLSPEATNAHHRPDLVKTIYKFLMPLMGDSSKAKTESMKVNVF